MKNPDELEIESLMQRYFDGLHQSNSTTLRTVFHPELAYINATPGNNEYLGLEAYMARIDKRTSPAGSRRATRWRHRADRAEERSDRYRRSAHDDAWT